jgi:hypothetical protein
MKKLVLMTNMELFVLAAVGFVIGRQFFGWPRLVSLDR